MPRLSFINVSMGMRALYSRRKEQKVSYNYAETSTQAMIEQVSFYKGDVTIVVCMWVNLGAARKAGNEEEIKTAMREMVETPNARRAHR